VALLDLVTIVGYFALAGLRAPPFEPWGVSIKVLQVIVLGGLIYLLAVGHRRSENAVLTDDGRLGEEGSS
jgi:hypothetical protein